ncbi:hypothetical protein V6N13_069884 [Hibiscus sabdariffa]
MSCFCAAVNDPIYGTVPSLCLSLLKTGFSSIEPYQTSVSQVVNLRSASWFLSVLSAPKVIGTCWQCSDAIRTTGSCCR